MRPRRLLSLYKKEKDLEVQDKTVLNVLVERDEVGVAGAARHLGVARSGTTSGAAGIWRRAWRGRRPARMACPSLWRNMSF